MDSVIQLLYEATDTGISHASKEAGEASDHYYEQIRSAFPDPFADDALSAFSEVFGAEAGACFARGFRLGARLMLEGLAEP